MDKWTYDIVKLSDMKLVSLYYWDFAAIDFNIKDLDKLGDLIKEIKSKIQEKGN